MIKLLLGITEFGLKILTASKVALRSPPLAAYIFAEVLLEFKKEKFHLGKLS